MTNDTTTLNGALAELGETMAANITAKGVSASASDGLTTLAGKISQISQSGGGTPVVEFDNTNFGTHFAFTRPSGNYKDTFTIHVPSGTTHLVEYCFYYLKNLTGIDLPTGLTEIGQSAFYYCEGLTEVEIPNTVAAIGQYAFYCCTSLQSVNIPTSLSSIPSNCFRYSGLTSVTIPSNITSMSSYAFGNCSNLETIHFDSATPPSLGTGVFQNLPTTCVIEVPCDSLSAYTSASNYPSSSTYTYVPYGCNGLKFLSDSYTTTTGSCELSLRLWDNNAPVSGGTITITGSDSSSYTCTTDSNGEATVTVTNVTGTVTYTATYGNYSATCTVTASSYLFYDDCSADNTSQYGTKHYLKVSSASVSLTYNSDGYYTVNTNGVDGFADIPIPALDNKNNYYVEAEFYTTDTSTGGQPGLVLYPTSDTGGNGVMFRDIASINRCGVLKFVNGSENGESGNSSQSSLPVANNWIKTRIEVNGTSVTGKWLKTDGTLVYSHTYTVPYTSGAMRVGLAFLPKSSSKPYRVRNIKAESL